MKIWHFSKIRFIFFYISDSSGGFVSNFRRGTGHMFSPSALDDFLARNGLSHVIRAHEVKEAGFQVCHQL